ncbi:MAG: PAS domain S-box protein [Candidatus Magnetominusculus sp. LBB02]|nr:PAS domain S-box protein [Candidatus Magnetominusculus sp. LBB02]
MSDSPQYSLNAAGRHVQSASGMSESVLDSMTNDQLRALIVEQTSELQSEINEHAGLIKLLTENIKEAFWIADAALTRTLYASPGYESVMGLSCESLYQDARSFLQAIHPDDKGRLLADMRVMKEGLPFDHDYRIVRPDGSVRWIWSRGFPDRRGGLSVYIGIVEDITERKLMEESLALERNTLKSIVDAMEDGLTIRDLDFNITYQSKMTLSMYGSRLGEKCYKVFGNSDSVCEGCPVELSYKDGQSHTFVKEVILPDGQIRYFENTANPIRDAGGTIVSCLEITKDITEQRRSAEALKKSEEKYRNLLDDAVDAIVIADYEGFYIGMNKKAEELWGFTEDELVGRHFSESMPEFEKERSQAAFHDVINNGHVSISNINFKCKDGSLIPVDINARVIEYGGKKVLQGIFRDVRQRIELLRRIEQEHSFRKAVEGGVRAGIAAFDLEGRQIYANPSFCEMVGWTQDELLDAMPPYVYWAPEDVNNIYDALKTALAGNAQPEGVDAILRRKNDERFDVNIALSPFAGEDGVKIGWLAAVYDITARKTMEKELKTKTQMLSELNSNLESLVSAKVEALRRNEQLLIQQSKMAAMGEMIAAITHQWRQPLNSLALMIQDLKDASRFGELTDDYIKKAANGTMEQIDFMSETINVFSNFFSPSKKKELFDVLSVVARVFSILSSELKTNQISYSITCKTHNKTFRDYSEVVSCEAAEITAYKNQLAHVLLNLINNSKDAIIVRHERGLLTNGGKICVDCYKDKDAIKVEISDNGGGVPDEIIDRVFEPYFSTKEDKGTGIGLYMSKVIIEESLGGKIYVSNRDDGSVFTVEVPARKPQ